MDASEDGSRCRRTIPLSPPSVMLLTPNGRWEVGKKICLSNSNYHPELWQPAWGIRTMIEALRAHFPAPGDGAIGALDWPSDIRKRLAKDVDCEKSAVVVCASLREDFGRTMKESTYVQLLTVTHRLAQTRIEREMHPDTQPQHTSWPLHCFKREWILASRCHFFNEVTSVTFINRAIHG